MSPLAARLARLHLVWLWFGVCVAIILVSQGTGAGMLDGGTGSVLFGILFLIGLPFILIGRLVVLLTVWAPPSVQQVLAFGVIIAAVAFADRALTRFLLAVSRRDEH